MQVATTKRTQAQDRKCVYLRAAEIRVNVIWKKSAAYIVQKHPTKHLVVRIFADSGRYTNLMQQVNFIPNATLMSTVYTHIMLFTCWMHSSLQLHKADLNLPTISNLCDSYYRSLFLQSSGFQVSPSSPLFSPFSIEAGLHCRRCWRSKDVHHSTTWTTVPWAQLSTADGISGFQKEGILPEASLGSQWWKILMKKSRLEKLPMNQRNADRKKISLLFLMKIYTSDCKT